jgi:hypothetical protein
MTTASTAPADALTRALTNVLREALEDVPLSDLDPDTVANGLAPALAARLATAVGASGISPAGLARALATPPADRGETVEARILAALRRYPGGRSPGVAPDVLRNLTGLPQTTLGPAVSSLVQTGELVRDAWLVRLPQPDDLLVPAQAPALPAEERSGDTRERHERRAIGDRRAVGERRLYERRTLDQP